MTAPAPLDLPALLDGLERAHAAATPGPVVVSDGWDLAVAHGSGEVVLFDAALADAILAAHAAVPTLIAELRKRDAALRAVEALMDFADGTGRVVFGISDGGAVWVRDIRAAVAAALSPESVQP